MDMIKRQIDCQKLPFDNGLLERVEGVNPSLYALAALISRTADILEKNGYLNDCFEDENYLAFDALDKLRGKFIDRLHEDETGITAANECENAIRDRHDYNRKSEAD